MSNKINVMLDLDGVMVDFPKFIEQKYGTSDYDKIRDMIGAGQLWKQLGQVDHLFLNLDPMPGYKTLFNYIYTLHKTGAVDRYEILTSLPYSTDKLVTSKQDKITWVRKYLDKDIPVNTVVGGAKKAQYVKSKNDILIDDMKRNIDEWNKAGGTGILFTSNGQAIAELGKILDSNK